VWQRGGGCAQGKRQGGRTEGIGVCTTENVPRKDQGGSRVSAFAVVVVVAAAAVVVVAITVQQVTVEQVFRWP
jgi:hypothetical protein